MRRLLTLSIIFSFFGTLLAQPANQEKKVLIQGFWWDYWNNNYPYGWANYLSDLAPRLKAIGIDAIWIPPSIKNVSKSSVGYSPFDHYDLGDKYQKGSDTTRLGTKDELLRLVAVMHANGIEVIQDIVPNHLIGAGSDFGNGGEDPDAPTAPCTDKWKNFRYSCYETPGTDQGATNYLSRKGRFPKNHHNFHPNNGHNCGLCDPNSDAWCWQGFGPDACYYDGAYGYSSNAIYNPDQSTYSPNNNGGIGPNNGYMRKHTREWLHWYKKQTGFDGVRLDGVKHYPYYATEDWLHAMQHSSGWANGGNKMLAVGEWVGSTAQLDNWCNQVQGRAGTFDFNLRAFDPSGGLRAMVYNYGTMDLGLLPAAQQNFRYVDIGGTRIHRTVPFVNNHDTYRPYYDPYGNIVGYDVANEFSPHIDIREPRLAAAFAVACAVDGNPQVFFEEVFNIANTSKRWTHLPTSTTDLPVNSDIVNIIQAHGALNFKGGVYKVRSDEPSHFNVLTGNNNDNDHLIIERSGKAIIAVTDNWNTDQESWVDTDFAPGTVLVDYSGGITTTSVVQPDKRANIKTRAVGYPSFAYSTDYADHGQHYHGYSIWAPQGANLQTYANSKPTIPTTQEWDMENDLGDSHCQSLGQGGRTPDNSTNPRVVGKIFVESDSTVQYEVYLSNPSHSLTVMFYDLQGHLLHSSSGSGTSIAGSFVNTAKRWIAIKVRNTYNNTSGQRCWVKVTYHGPALANTLSYPAQNQVFIWTSNGGSSDWNNCRNWEEGKIASCTGTVVIPHPVDHLPALDSCFSGTILPGYCIEPAIDTVILTQPTSCNPPDGSITVNASGYGNLEFSIDGGANWQTNPQFNNLLPGNYDVMVRLQAINTCTLSYNANPVVLNTPTNCCPLTLAINSNPIPSGSYLAANEITSSGKVVSGANVVFDAMSVVLQPLFEVEAGAVFTIMLTGCTP